MKILIEVEVFGGYEDTYKNNTDLLLKHMTGRLQGVKAKAIKNNSDIASVIVSVCPKCEYKLHSSGQCVNQFCSGWSRNTER